MNIVEIILASFHNTLLLSFLFGMIAEELVLFLAILSGKGELGLFGVLIGGFLGSLFMDQIYFLIGKSHLISKLKKVHLISKHHHKLPSFVKEFGHGTFLKRMSSIFLTKFIYGTRGAAVVFLGAKNIDYKKFIFADILAIFLWAIIMIPIAWLAGRGITIFLKLSKGFEKLLFIALLLVVVYYLIMKLIFEKRIDSLVVNE